MHCSLLALHKTMMSLPTGCHLCILYGTYFSPVLLFHWNEERINNAMHLEPSGTTYLLYASYSDRKQRNKHKEMNFKFFTPSSGSIWCYLNERVKVRWNPLELIRHLGGYEAADLLF